MQTIPRHYIQVPGLDSEVISAISDYEEISGIPFIPLKISKWDTLGSFFVPKPEPIAASKREGEKHF